MTANIALLQNKLAAFNPTFGEQTLNFALLFVAKRKVVVKILY